MKAKNIFNVLLLIALIVGPLYGEEPKESKNAIDVNVATFANYVFFRNPTLELSYYRQISDAFSLDASVGAYFIMPFVSIGSSYYLPGNSSNTFFLSASVKYIMASLNFQEALITVPVKLGYRIIASDTIFFSLGLGSDILFLSLPLDNNGTHVELGLSPFIISSIGFIL